MKRKNFLMGLGIGLVCSGAVLMLFQGAARGETQLTEAQIRERAAKLGMVDRSENAILNSELQQVESDAESDSVGTSVSNDNAQGDDNQDLVDSDTDSGQKTGKTDPSNVDKTDKVNEAGKEDKADSSTQTDTAQDIKTKDKKNKKKKEEDKTNVLENEDGTDNDSLDKNDNSSDNAKGSKKKKKTGSTVTITIEPGMVADQICAKLQENNVIKDEKEFLDYIIGKSLQSKLLAGTFELKKDMNYDDILQEIAK